MDTPTQKFKIRLGLFIAGGLAIFVFAIFIIGKQKNLFSPVFRLTSSFYNVSGLQVGNNVRFSGITVGTVDRIGIINDSTIKVDMLIRKEVKQFIKTDCEVAIGSSGLIGDKLLIITQGSTDAAVVKDGQQLESMEPVEMDAIMANLQITSEQLAEIMFNINNSNGTLGRLINDSSIANNFSQTMVNIRTSSKGFSENMDAAKHNFLLKGYFNKKAAAAEEKKKEAEDKKAADEKAKEKAEKKAAKQKAKDEKK